MAPSPRRKVVSAKVTDAEKRRYPSKHYVYIIQVTWDDGSDTVIFRRYSKFFDFQIGLLESFPVEGGLKNPVVRTIPFLPGKILFRRSHIRDVAMKRLKPIDEYVNELLRLPPHISQSEQVLNFFESKQEDLHPPKEETKRKKKDEQDIGEISGPILLEQYTAICDYTRTQPKELTVTSGQMLEVIEKHENGWWFVSDEEGERGWVPGVYLEKRDGTSEDLVTKQSELGQGEKYVTTAQFTGGKDEVSFGVGVLVEVLQKNLEGWWLVSYQGKQGWAPASYLEKPADAVLRQTFETGPNPSSKSMAENRRSLPADAVQAVLPLSAAAASSSNASNPRKHLNLKRINSNPPSANRKNHVAASPPSRPQSSQTRPPPKKSSVKRGSFKPQKPPPLPPSPAVKDEPVYDYVTNSPFHADIPHGISFQQDKKVQVLEKSPGDWWYVSLEGEEGWAPASHITRVFHKEKPRQPPARPNRPTSSSQASKANCTKREVANANGTKSPQPSKIDLEKPSSHANGSSKPCLPSRPLPPVPALQKANSSAKNVSTSVNRTTSWKISFPAAGDRRFMPGESDESTNGESNSKNTPKPAVTNKTKVQLDRKVVPPRPATKPAIVLAKPNANASAIEGVGSKKKPRPPSVVSKKVLLNNKETQAKDSSESNKNGHVDFRSMLKPAPKKPIAHSTPVQNDDRQMKKPPVLPGKPVIPGKPATKSLPGQLKSASATTKKAPASASRPKVPSAKPKPERPNSKPVLKRFQVEAEHQNINGNNNAEKNDKPVLVVNRLHVQQVIPSISLPFNLRGTPDGQVDEVKVEERIKSENEKMSHANGVLAPDVLMNDCEGTKYIAVRDFTPKDDNEMGFIRGSEATLIEKSMNNWWYMKINEACGWVPCSHFEPQPPGMHNETNKKSDSEEIPRSNFCEPETAAMNSVTASEVHRAPLQDDSESFYSEIGEPNSANIEPQKHCELYKAGSGFGATDDTMISLAFGDVVQLLHKADTGWWYVKVILSSINSMDEEGWVPADYLDQL